MEKHPKSVLNELFAASPPTYSYVPEGDAFRCTVVIQVGEKSLSYDSCGTSKAAASCAAAKCALQSEAVSKKPKLEGASGTHVERWRAYGYCEEERYMYALRRPFLFLVDVDNMANVWRSLLTGSLLLPVGQVTCWGYCAKTYETTAVDLPERVLVRAWAQSGPDAADYLMAHDAFTVIRLGHTLRLALPYLVIASKDNAVLQNIPGVLHAVYGFSYVKICPRECAVREFFTEDAASRLSA